MRKTLLLGSMLLACTLSNAQTTAANRWAITAGGSTVNANEAIKGMMIDASGNAYVIGNYTGTITLTGSGGGTYTSAGGQDVFVARFDNTGACTWSTAFGSTGDDEGNAICFYKNTTGAVTPTFFYITGNFSGNVTISGTALTLGGSCGAGASVTDTYVARYNVSGSTVSNGWAKSIGSYYSDGLAIEANSTDVYVAGWFDSFMDDPSTCNPMLYNDGTTAAGHDFFVARYSSTGTFVSAVSPQGSSGDCEARGITLNTSNVYITGTYRGNLNISGTNMSCSGYSDIFVGQYPLSLSTTGSDQCRAGGPNTQGPTPTAFHEDGGYAISATGEGVFVAGRYLQTCTFVTTAGSVSYTPSAGLPVTYMFLARYATSINAATPAILSGDYEFSEAYGMYAVHQYASPLAPASEKHRTAIFLCGSANPNSTIQNYPSTIVAIDGTTPLAGQIGFVGRFGYDDWSTVQQFYNSGSCFVDGISDNIGGILGTGSEYVNGYAVGYNGCDVVTAGNFSGTSATNKTAFGSIVKTTSGVSDAFITARTNQWTVTSSTYTCGSAVLTGSYVGAGTASYSWSTGAITPSVTVTPTPNTTTTYSVTVSDGVCPSFTTPISVYAYPNATTGSAGPDANVCPGHPATLGGTAVPGATYSWTPSTGLSSTTAANPVCSTTGNTTYTVTITDYCGNVSTDAVFVHYDAFCPRRMANPDMVEANVVELYPNPAHGSFTISTNDANAKTIIVYDVTGKIILQKETAAEQQQIDLGDAPAGIYLVKIISGGNVTMQRFMNE